MRQAPGFTTDRPEHHSSPLRDAPARLTGGGETGRVRGGPSVRHGMCRACRAVGGCVDRPRSQFVMAERSRAPRGGVRSAVPCAGTSSDVAPMSRMLASVTWPFLSVSCSAEAGWCRGAESNCRHHDFQSCALPTELPRHGGSRSGRTLNIPRTSARHDRADAQAHEPADRHIERVVHADEDARSADQHGQQIQPRVTARAARAPARPRPPSTAPHAPTETTSSSGDSRRRMTWDR